MVLFLAAMVMATLLVLVPKILRAQQSQQERQHAERLRSLEKDLPIPSDDNRARAAGRTASLVPIVTVIVAGTVTCFLVAYRSDSLLAVTISVWSVAGVVCLAAVTGGVALLGRLAQFAAGETEDEAAEMPIPKKDDTPHS